MILYKDWGKHLRLGNWLFNYFALLGIAHKTGHELAFPNYFAWQYFKYPPKIDDGIQEDELFHFRTNHYSREEMDWLYKFFEENKHKTLNINLGSNNQSELWFQDSLDYIKEHAKFTPPVIADVCKKYSHILGNSKKTIGIGIRRGDFVNHGCFYQIPLDWYLKALEIEFPDWKEYNILFFSDNIDEIKTIFKGDNFFFAEPNGTHTHAENFKYYHQNPMEQFILGTLCDHFIGGSSTFTWWQMWYVKNFNNGKVVHCGENLAGECRIKFDNPNYYPESWTLCKIN